MDAVRVDSRDGPAEPEVPANDTAPRARVKPKGGKRKDFDGMIAAIENIGRQRALMSHESERLAYLLQKKKEQEIRDNLPPEKIAAQKAKKAAWIAANRELIRKAQIVRARRYRQNNPHKVKQQSKRWRDNNPEKNAQRARDRTAESYKKARTHILDGERTVCNTTMTKNPPKIADTPEAATCQVCVRVRAQRGA